MAIQVPPYDSCSFCRYVARKDECAFVAENELVAAFVNRAQFERGALLVIPRAHRETILQMQDAELAAVYALAKRLAQAAIDAFGAVAVNVFQNNGVKSGQEIPHYHAHVLPRYETSDPNKLFRAAEFPRTPIEQQRAVAAALRAVL